ncbi:hypothetical protein [Parasitella parasitica]|uniref:AMP-dependent synthetase/ligase domain-containing protein n=1 Tax=Parasitella parasitica TaxID=35722 RepID=A0A0B7NHY5_9FUNG|nr:hypothetical protein [Parasitella parasitica]
MLGCSGSVVKNALIKEAQEQLNITVLNKYGMTEAIGMFTTTSVISAAGVIDYLNEGFTARIIDENGKDVADDQVGELLVKGPSVSPGYYGQPGSIVDTEHIITKHPKVADCAVFGVYQPELATEFPCPYVMFVDGEFDPQEVIQELEAFSDDLLPEEKRIRAGIKIVDSFPRTSPGKIQRLVLRQTAIAVSILKDLSHVTNKHALLDYKYKCPNSASSFILYYISKMIYTSKEGLLEPLSGDSIYDILFRNGNDIPLDKPVLIDIEAPYKTLTYGDLKKQILVAAGGLKRVFNIQKNDIVAVCSPNHIDYVSILHGTICAGGVFAALHYISSVEDLIYDLNTVRAKYLVTHKDTIDKALAAAKVAGIDESNIVVFGDASIQGIRAVDDTILNGNEEAEPIKYTKEQMQNDTAFLYFTSGTTGRKKAVMRTQDNILYSMGRLPKAPDSASLSYLDFNHSSSLIGIMMVTLYYGWTTYLLNHYSLRGLCAAIQEYKPKYLCCAPYVISSLMKDSIAREYDISSIAMIGCCGAVLKKAVTDEAREKFNINVLDMYGMTEILGIFCTDVAISAAGGIGYLKPGFTARLVDDDGQDVLPGQAGELLIKGPSLTPGYYNNPLPIVDNEGYFHTGDLFKCDANGLFSFCERKKDLIKSFKTHIYPSEIEQVMIKHPKVADCAAIGVYHEESGTEFLRLYVKLIDGQFDSQEIVKELQAYSDEQLAEAKRVRAGIEIVDSFPRTSSGKIQRLTLRQTATAVPVVN